MNKNKTQRSIASKTTGSLINYVMGNNNTLPVVGQGATRLSWSDRHAYEVMSVSKDGKCVIIQQYIPERNDPYGMSDCQEYKYEKLDGNDTIVIWRYNAWYIEYEAIEYVEEYYKNVVEKNMPFYKHKDFKLLFPNNHRRQNKKSKEV